MVRYIARSRTTNKEEFDRVYLAAMGTAHRKMTGKGIIIESGLLINISYPGMVLPIMATYAHTYPYTYLLND